MHYDRGHAIVGRLSGAEARYQTNAGRKAAIEKVEKLEAQRQAELEQVAGRKLTAQDIARGGVDHVETRDRRDIAKSRVTVTERSDAPRDGAERALAYNQQKLAEEQMSPRERQRAAINRSLQEQIDSRKRDVPPSPETIKRQDEARQFAQLVAFTSGATVEQVERAAALADVAGDGVAFAEAMNSLRSDIAETLSQGLPDAQAAVTSIKSRAAMFQSEPTRPESLDGIKLVAPWESPSGKFEAITGGNQ